ncbi:MAG: transposase, partial [Phycisphaerae bacterium]|nr:transposase [Phycisphaerae bacterium]
MAAPYSDDLRDRVLAAYDRGMKTKQIAQVFQVSPAWARRIKQCRRETGRVRPLPTGGKRIQKIDPVLLAELVRQQPDATLKELRERLGVVCALSSVWGALDKIKLSFKKSRCTRPSRTARTWPGAV